MQRRDVSTCQDSNHIWGTGEGCGSDGIHDGAPAVGGKVIFQAVGGYKGRVQSPKNNS